MKNKTTNTPKKQHKYLKILVTPQLYDEFENTSSKRFINGSKSKFGRLAFKLLLTIHKDKKRVIKLHNMANNRFKEYNHYSDRLCKLIEESLDEYIENHEGIVN